MRVLLRTTLLTILIALAVWWYNCLPAPLFADPVAPLLLDRDGKLLGAHIAADEQWRFPELTQVPPKFATALVAAEDKRFYQHLGVDPLALARAMYWNLRRQRVVSGASTISMQVIRLARKNPSRNMQEKFAELFRATRLESRYSKDDILRLYASHAPFGGNVVGLEAAAWRYFGRDPAQLSWAESALLAVLPNNPALIHPGRNRERLLNKRNQLLLKLYQQQQLPELDYQLAIAEPLPDAPHALPQQAPHLLDTLMLRYPTTERFYSTLDATLQRQLNELTARSAEALGLEGIQNLAVLVLDNHTFATLAYIGNSPNSGLDNGHAIDLVQRPRSTGSTLKPLLFADMIDQGLLLPDSLIADVPVNYHGFTPQNYDRRYHGATSAKQALASSLNIPAVNMLSLRGVAPFLTQLRQLGLQHANASAEHYGLSLILGGAEGTLWELTGMYANFSHRASQDATQQQATWLQGRVLQSDKASTDRATTLSTASSWLTLQTLLAVNRPGEEGYWENFSSSRKVAWKTGTSYGQRDGWAIGTTRDYTVGVWVGNADGTGRAGLTGTKSAAPLLFNTFGLLPYSSEWIPRPDWQLQTIAVCQDDGYLSNGACATHEVLAPRPSRFARITPYHQRIHLDATGQWRVNSDCALVSSMQSRDWFVLPPDQAHYYQQGHANYQTLPPWRADCQGAGGSEALTLVYPNADTEVYLPRELDGKLGKVVLQAMPSKAETLLYWHLDNVYLGSTQTFHQMAAQTEPGRHLLSVVDEMGNRVEQWFTVLWGD